MLEHSETYCFWATYPFFKKGQSGCDVTVSIMAFQAIRSGSNPGDRISKLFLS